MGGSQGAKILNNYVPEAYAQLANLGEHVVLHSAGRGREAEVRSTDKNKAYKNYKNKAYRVVPYVDAALAWAAADVAITRAGSSTLAEAAFYGVPLIMVPFAAAAEQHQLHNAHAVEGSGAGIVVEEHQLRASITPLIDAWQRLAEVEHRHQAQQAAIARAYPQAAERLLVALGLTSDNTNPATAENKQAAEASYQQGAAPHGAPHGAPHVYGNNPNTSTANIIKSNTSTANTSTANTSTSNITTQETP